MFILIFNLNYLCVFILVICLVEFNVKNWVENNFVVIVSDYLDVEILFDVDEFIFLEN